jgi:[lysine-biosynthesis-protein LysW]--L-2-aminoadipate ligase
LGASVRRTEITESIRLLCHQVTELTGPGFYGVDLVEDVRDKQLRVLEVNANPEFARSSREHGVNIADLLACHVAERIRGVLVAA